MVVLKSSLYIVAAMNILLAGLTLYFCGRIIWIHILRQ